MIKKQYLKISALFGFVVLLFGSTAFMYFNYIKDRRQVEPTTVPYRTKQNPYFVDSLKKSGYYDTFSQ